MKLEVLRPLEASLAQSFQAGVFRHAFIFCHACSLFECRCFALSYVLYCDSGFVSLLEKL